MIKQNASSFLEVNLDPFWRGLRSENQVIIKNKIDMNFFVLIMTKKLPKND